MQPSEAQKPANSCAVCWCCSYPIAISPALNSLPLVYAHWLPTCPLRLQSFSQPAVSASAATSLAQVARWPTCSSSASYTHTETHQQHSSNERSALHRQHACCQHTHMHTRTVHNSTTSARMRTCAHTHLCELQLWQADLHLLCAQLHQVVECGAQDVGNRRAAVIGPLFGCNNKTATNDGADRADGVSVDIMAVSCPAHTHAEQYLVSGTYTLHAARATSARSPGCAGNPTLCVLRTLGNTPTLKPCRGLVCARSTWLQDSGASSGTSSSTLGRPRGRGGAAAASAAASATPGSARDAAPGLRVSVLL